MKKILFFALLIISQFSAIAQNEVWNFLDKGQYNVGFKVFPLYDSSRTINDANHFRPVQVSLWYPAKASDVTPMNYKDYFILSAEETDYEISDVMKDSAIVRYKNLLKQNGVIEEAADKWFRTRMLAVKDAKPKPGKYPLIVVAQGNFHSAHHQAFLCELLASNGYVVITTPSQTRISGQLTDASQAVESANEQVTDMKFAIKSLRYFGNIDFSNIALLGHSFGGRSIQVLQMKNKNVKCLVSLDGGLGLNTAVDDIKKSPDFDSNKMDVPLLHFYEDTETFLTPDFRLINSYMKSKRFLVKINNMHHFYFSTLGLVSGIIKGFNPLSENTGEKYKIICDMTRDFLNTVFKNNELEMDDLRNKFSLFAGENKFISFVYK